MSEQFEGLKEGMDDIFSDAEVVVTQKKLEANLLSKEELKTIKDVFREYRKAEMQKNWKDRRLFVDEYGATWVLCRTPDETYEYGGKTVERKPGRYQEKDKKGNPVLKDGKPILKEWYMSGYNASLLGQFSNFLLTGTLDQRSLVGFSLNAVLRGEMKYKYFFNTEKYGSARYDNQFVKAYNDKNDTDYKSLDEIDRTEYKINMIFNYWQTVGIKGG